MATKKVAAKKTSVKKTASKKAPAKKAAEKVAASKSAPKKAVGRKYAPEASQSVEREMKAMKQGKLKSGSGQTVTNPKQAIAIGLSEARRSGKKVPKPPSER